MDPVLNTKNLNKVKKENTANLSLPDEFYSGPSNPHTLILIKCSVNSRNGTKGKRNVYINTDQVPWRRP